MSLNWCEIDQILEELPIVGCHIQKVTQPTYNSLVMELYRPGGGFTLMISLAQAKTRLHKVEKPKKGGVKLQRFAQFLRSRIKGGKIVKATQLGRERIVELQVSRAGEQTTLWIRLWSGAANIIATDESMKILDAFYRRPNRGECSGGYFDPSTVTPANPNVIFTSRFDPESKSEIYPVNELVCTHYDKITNEEEIATLSARVRRTLEQRESYLLTTINTLKKQLINQNEPDRQKEIGDLLTTNLHLIRQGERWITVEDYYNDNQLLQIELSPSHSPEENAQRYYTSASRRRKTLQHSNEQLENLSSQLEEVRRQTEQLLVTPDIAYLKNYLESNSSKATEKLDQGSPGLRFTSNGFTIHVGRTAKENDALLRKHVKGNDTWLHVRDYPGAYVFIKSIPGKSIPLETLLDAGNLSIYYSKRRNSQRGDLYYTKVKYLRRAKGGKLGTVIPTQEKNLSVTIDKERLRRLQTLR